MRDSNIKVLIDDRIGAARTSERGALRTIFERVARGPPYIIIINIGTAGSERLHIERGSFRTNPVVCSAHRTIFQFSRHCATVFATRRYMWFHKIQQFMECFGTHSKIYTKIFIIEISYEIHMTVLLSVSEIKICPFSSSLLGM
jgi:hypothetical protein